MPWTLTSAAARAADALALRRRWTAPASVARASGLSQRGTRPEGDTVYDRIFERRAAAASAPDRKGLEAALDAVGEDRAVLRRAVASGAPLTAVAGLAARWDGLPAPARSMVVNPLGHDGPGAVAWASVRAVQVDQTTCGAASMAMMLMITDPFVALWVATGAYIGDYVPPEPLGCEAAQRPIHTVDERWRSLQRHLHAATARHALGPFPWPRSLGTPPWRVDDLTRCAGLRFRGALVDDSDEADLTAMLAHASATLRDGIPVPVFTAGDSSLGLDTAIPRHVVLFVAKTPAGFLVYEPGSGAVHEVSEALLARHEGRLAALGYWSRLSWFVLPTPRD